MNGGFTDLERHEGESLITSFSFLGELTNPLTLLYRIQYHI